MDSWPSLHGMHIAILTFDGYNELDSLIALGILNRVSEPGWRVSIIGPTPRLQSMNGVTIDAMIDLDEACTADAVIIGSGRQTREVVEDPAIMNSLRQLDPSRQLLAAQCSGALVLAKLGHLKDVPACTDLMTKPWVVAASTSRYSTSRSSPAATSPPCGGCLASTYLATWTIARLHGLDAAKDAMYYVAPVGEKEDYVERALLNVTPYLKPVLTEPERIKV